MQLHKSSRCAQHQSVHTQPVRCPLPVSSKASRRPAAAAAVHATCSGSSTTSSPQQQHTRRVCTLAAAIADAPTTGPIPAAASGHTALLHGLGDVGDVPAAYMPWVLRIAAACAQTSGGDSQAAMSDICRGISCWRASLNRGLLPDDEAIQQLQHNNEPFTKGGCVGWVDSRGQRTDTVEGEGARFVFVV